jgi:hypothetical protein
MIIYNVTLSIHPEIEKEALTWLRQVHIPEVMATHLFVEFNMYKVILDHTEKNYNSYAIQYTLDSWAKFDEYNEKFASALREKTLQKYGDNILAFRTFLEKME